MSEVGGRYRHLRLGGIFFTELDVTMIDYRRTEPIIGSFSYAFDLDFQRTTAISARNLRRTSA